MDKDMMAVLSAVTQVCGLIGMALYYTLFIRVEAKPIMFWGILVSA